MPSQVLAKGFHELYLPPQCLQYLAIYENSLLRGDLLHEVILSSLECFKFETS